MQTLIYQFYPNWDGNPASLSGFVPDASAILNMDINTFTIAIGFIGILGNYLDFSNNRIDIC